MFFFLELSCFFYDPVDVGNLISGSSAFSKSSWTSGSSWVINYFASVWDECNCAVVWTFFDIAFLWDQNENWPFSVLWPLLSFPNLWHVECSTFTASSFRVWNSSTGIPSPQLALFIVMFPKAHLTLHSNVSVSRWVITPSWLCQSLRSFLYSSSMYCCHFFLIFFFC